MLGCKVQPASSPNTQHFAYWFVLAVEFKQHRFHDTSWLNSLDSNNCSPELWHTHGDDHTNNAAYQCMTKLQSAWHHGWLPTGGCLWLIMQSTIAATKQRTPTFVKQHVNDMIVSYGAQNCAHTHYMFAKSRSHRNNIAQHDKLITNMLTLSTELLRCGTIYVGTNSVWQLELMFKLMLSTKYTTLITNSYNGMSRYTASSWRPFLVGMKMHVSTFTVTGHLYSPDIYTHTWIMI